MALNPSYDFNLFGLDQFSPLLANELGASTSFNASDPASYVDWSLNQLGSLLQPFNPLPYIQSQFPSIIVPQPPSGFFQTPQQKVGTPTGESVNVVAPLPTRGGDIINVYPSGTVPPELQHQGAPVQTSNKFCDDCIKFGRMGNMDCQALCAGYVGGGGGAAAGAGTNQSAADKKDPNACGWFDISCWFGKTFGAATKGAGVFIIAIIILILLLLFVRK